MYRMLNLTFLLCKAHSQPSSLYFERY